MELHRTSDGPSFTVIESIGLHGLQQRNRG
jgi:hypothetical protein